MTVSLLLGLTSLFVSAAEPKEDALKKELEKFQGTWKVTEVNSEVLPADILKTATGQRVRVTGNDVQWLGDEKHKVKFKLDPSKNPPHIDFTPDKDAKKDAIIDTPAIYELDGDTLKVCFPLGKSIRKIDPKTKEVIEEKSDPLVRPKQLGGKETVMFILKREIKK